MNVRFITPPKELQKGGIENAVEGLREALIEGGTKVVDGLDLDDPEAIHHFHGLWNPAHARLAATLRRVGRPYVVSPHGMLEPWAFRNRWWKKLPYFRFVERRFLMGAASLFVTSTMERDHLRRLLLHPRVEVLPLGCRDPQTPAYEASRRLLGWGADERVMLFLSRVDPKKGLHLLFDALAGLGSAASQWKLIVVGDGPRKYRQELGLKQQQWGKALPSIKWVGGVWGHDRWKYLQAADLFCLPTHSENFGIAVLESMLVGTPVITTDQTPWRDFREVPGVSICSPNVPSLTSELAKAIGLAEEWVESDRIALADWARTRFSWDSLTNQYVSAYHEAAMESA